MKLPGYATPSGTEWYRKRFAKSVAPEHFRQSQNLWLSSIGLGTYLGNYDAETDQLYHRAVVHAVQSGCNVIDSAINYRFQRSERAIGAYSGRCSLAWMASTSIFVGSAWPTSTRS